jgi:hypothetical protein
VILNGATVSYRRRSVVLTVWEIDAKLQALEARRGKDDRNATLAVGECDKVEFTIVSINSLSYYSAFDSNQ